MKRFEVVTVGSALKDIMFYSDQISIVKNKKDLTRQKLMAVEYGAKIPIKDIFVNYGGGALNTAVGFKNFGLNVAPMVCLGDDLVGQEIFSYLKRKKINTYLMSVDKKEKTGFSVIITAAKEKEHTIFTHKGATDSLEVHSLRNFKAKWFYVSALSNQSWAMEFDKIIRQTKRNTKIAWNPGNLQLEDWEVLIKFLPSVEVLILNKDEALELVKRAKPKTAKKDLTNTKFLLKKLREFGVQKAVITQGARGAAAIDQLDKYYYLPAAGQKQKIVDTVGAGDAFSSGLVAGLVKWDNFEKALQLGIRNSARVLTRVGAQNGLLEVKL